MKRVGRWTWMLLTLLLLLCGTVFAANEKTYIELDQPVELTFSDSVSRYELYLDVPVAGTRVLLDSQSFDWNSNSTGFYIGGSDSANVAGKRIFSVNEAGEQLVCVSYYDLKQGETQTVQFTLREYKNDAQEPNDVTPTELHDGDAISFTLDGGDRDQFAITTIKPGQDIALTIGGFSYASRGRFDIQWQNNDSLIVEKNGVYYLHAGQPGRYTFTLEEWSSSSPSITRTMSVQLLDGDGHEPNDTMQTATPLLIGTDETFTLGGLGDEDWFCFEAAPEDGQTKLYTLRLLDFDFENPENVCYEIYAPDGTVAASKTEVSSRHTRVFSCSQQGQYAVRLYPNCRHEYNYVYDVSIQRAALRIRVEEGGDDPYENNDTWLGAAYIEPGQLISHVLSSGDTDWFCFTVPEDHMTLHVSSDCVRMHTMVYTGQDLAEFGESAKAIYDEKYMSATNLYWKLDEKGLYYIKLDGGSSEKICSTTISLIPPEAIEDNDTWYRATPLYEEFTQAFDISAENDSEWFRFTVPQGSQKAVLLNISVIESGRGWSDFSLYRKAYFDGQDDERIQWWDSFHGSTKKTYELEPGIYYLEVSARSFGDRQKLSICYKLVPQLNNDTIAASAPLTERVWQDVWQAGYFSIGERKAGEVVQIQYDNRGSKPKEYIHVYDADGKEITSSYRANLNFRIPTDGVYYLKVPECDVNVNAENEPMHLAHIRYYTHNDKIGAVESVTMRPNESVFLDVWFSPDISLSVESEVENLTYDRETGYLTAPDTTEGSAKLVFSNGYAEGNKYRIETSVNVSWSEKLLSGISISNAPQSLTIGSSAMLEANVDADSYIKYVSWKSSDPSVLRVLSNGKVVAVGQGEAVITASIGEATSSVTITVTGEQPGESGLTGVSLDRYTLTLYAGEEAEQLTATLKPEGTEATIRWTSSNQTAATVSQDGKVTPLSAGVTVVTAAAGDYRASCIVTVQPERVRVTGIRFDEPTHTLMMGSTVTLQPIIAPDDATVKNLTWVSSDEQTATVSRTGIVTALSVGETTITATTVDGGYSAEIKIIVTAAAQLGDVNGDGYIDAADALLCLRASVGLITLTPEQEAAADVNHDGLVDAGDAILILRYDARLIPNLN